MQTSTRAEKHNIVTQSDSESFGARVLKYLLFSDVLMPDNINIKKVFVDVKSCSLVHGSNVLNGRAASFLGPAAGPSETFVPPTKLQGVTF